MIKHTKEFLFSTMRHLKLKLSSILYSYTLITIACSVKLIYNYLLECPVMLALVIPFALP